jgi:hypothetical protein
VIAPSITLNYIIKILPDATASTLNVVTSIDALTGDFVCNTGITCATNTIALNLTPYIPSLTNQPAPNANNDYLILYNAGTNSTQKVKVGAVAAAATAGVASIAGATGALLLGSGLGVTGSTISNTGVLSINSLTGALNAWMNVPLSKTADYPLVSADCFKTIALGGSAFFTLTLNAANTYTNNCLFVIKNTDSGRGKLISANGITSFILWPLQSVTIVQIGTAWQTSSLSRWLLPSSTTFNVSSTGTDTNNDCLGTATGACATFQGAINLVAAQIDAGHKQVIVSGATGGAATENIRLVNIFGNNTDYTDLPPILRGSANGDPTQFILTCGIVNCITGVNSTSGWKIEAFSLVGTGSTTCILADNKSIVFAGNNVYDCPFAHFLASYGSTIETIGSWSSFGPSTYEFYAAGTGSQIIVNGGTVNYVPLSGSHQTNWAFMTNSANIVVTIGTGFTGTTTNTNCIVANYGGGYNTDGRVGGLPCTGGDAIDAGTFAWKQ